MDKTGWTKVKLGDICTINSGKGIKKSEYVDDGEYAIIGANGEIGRVDAYNNDKPVITTGRVGTIGTIQKVKRAWITDNTLIVDIKNSSLVDYNYLYYVMHLIDFKAITTGNAQPLVTSGRLKEVEVYLPPMEIQLQIAKLLTTIDNIIQSKSDESTKYQNMKTQIMNDIFNNGEREQNWTKVKLGDICEKIQDGNYGKEYPKANELLDSGIPLINGAAVHGHIIVSELKYISEEMNNRLKKARIYTGDVLFLNRGSIGDTSIVTKEYDNCNIGPQVTLLRPNRSVISTEFLLYLLHSPEIVKLSDSAGGSTIKFLSVNKIRDVEVYLPPMEIQLMIATLLTMYDDVIETVNKEKEDYEKIKTQMMNMIFA